MTIGEFTLLNETDQVIVVWEGAFLAERVYKGMTVQVYAVGDFYVELWYHTKQNRTVRIRPFGNRRLLEPYWKRVSLNELAELL